MKELRKVSDYTGHLWLTKEKPSKEHRENGPAYLARSDTINEPNRIYFQWTLENTMYFTLTL